MNVYVKNGPVALFEFGDIAEFLVTVARGLRGDRATWESVTRLHSAQAVGYHDRNRVRSGGKMIMEGGELGFVGVSLEGVGEDVQQSV